MLPSALRQRRWPAAQGRSGPQRTANLESMRGLLSVLELQHASGTTLLCKCLHLLKGSTCPELRVDRIAGFQLHKHTACDSGKQDITSGHDSAKNIVFSK